MTNPLTEINQLTEELAEAIAVATFESLEATIDAWHEAELLAGREVPDFWDDCRTSEMLAQHLTALGWVRAPSVQALVDASGHTPEDAALILDEMARVGPTSADGVLGAAIALIADVRRRHPGEALRCPLMIALDEATKENTNV